MPHAGKGYWCHRVHRGTRWRRWRRRGTRQCHRGSIRPWHHRHRHPSHHRSRRISHLWILGHRHRRGHAGICHWIPPWNTRHRRIARLHGHPVGVSTRHLWRIALRSCRPLARCCWVICGSRCWHHRRLGRNRCWCSLWDGRRRGSRRWRGLDRSCASRITRGCHFLTWFGIAAHTRRITIVRRRRRRGNRFTGGCTVRGVLRRFLGKF